MKREHTVLFGNGINRLTNVVSWNDVLQKIGGKVHDRETRPPNTLIYERAVLEQTNGTKQIRQLEFAVKDEIAEELRKTPPDPLYRDLFELSAKNYLTSNYDYAFRDTILQNKRLNAKNQSTEDIYSVRRYTSIMDGDSELCKIWQVHGELDRPRSIMLGVDQYSGSVGKIDAYVKGKYTYTDASQEVRCDTIGAKLGKGRPWDGVSWVELFFRTDMHILGFGLDYSEIDLWWVLVKRARMMNDIGAKNKVRNHVRFYANDIDKDKAALLSALKVEVVLSNAPKPADTAKETLFYRGQLERSIIAIRRTISQG